MNEQVEKFLEERRLAFLLNNGLYKKIYRPADEECDDVEKDFDLWPESEYASDGVTFYRYRKEPLSLSEDEWAQIERVAALPDLPEAEEGQNTNGVATLLKVLAVVVYVSAFIVGIVMASITYSGFLLCLLYWAIGLFSGSLLLGFSEVIRLLHEIRQK